MLQLIGSARNLFLMPRPPPDRLESSCELILLVHEKGYAIAGDGAMVAESKVNTIRFHVSAKAMKNLAITAAAIYDEMMALEESVEFNPAEETLAEVSVPAPL